MLFNVTHLARIGDMPELVVPGLCALVVALPVLILRYLYLRAAKTNTKVMLCAAMAAVYVGTVLLFARLFAFGAATVEQCYHAWTLAFLAGTVLMVFQAALIFLVRPKRRLTETEKMKLKDV